MSLRMYKNDDAEWRMSPKNHVKDDDVQCLWECIRMMILNGEERLAKRITRPHIAAHSALSGFPSCSQKVPLCYTCKTRKELEPVWKGAKRIPIMGDDLNRSHNLILFFWTTFWTSWSFHFLGCKITFHFLGSRMASFLWLCRPLFPPLQFSFLFLLASNQLSTSQCR